MSGIGKEEKYSRCSAGFTLVEALMAITIVAFCLCGLLATYINMFFLTDLTRDVTLATNAVRAKMEEIKRLSFASLSAESPRWTFNLTDYGFPSNDSKGVVEIQENYSNYTDQLTKVRVSAYFKSRGRVIGEDANLNGAFDTPGEDVNNNGRQDSPVEMVTLIAK